MNHLGRTVGSALRRTQLGLFEAPEPTTDSAPVARWLINGFPATVIIWTRDQWAVLKDRPSDAQRFPDGFWCALRME